MAKKKKQTKKSKAPQAESIPKERGAFWPLAGAVIMVVVAVFLLLGGFGTGGDLPTGLFNIAYWLLGRSAYLLPLALGFWAFYKFRSEEYRIPLTKIISMILLIVSSACWWHVAFVSKDVSTLEYVGGYGGSVGSLAGGLVLKALDKIPAVIGFSVIVFFCFLYVFSISPKVLLGVFGLFKKKEADTDLEELKNEKRTNGFKLNEGVPVEHHQKEEEKPRPRLSSMRNSAQPLSVKENHEALTVATDMNWEFPAISLLNQKQDKADAGDVQGNAETIRETLTNFNIHVEMEGANIGPRVTQYTLKPPTGVKLTKITALENNLALDLAAHSIRMEAPIPGKRLVGIEVPNVKPAMVRVSGLLQSKEWNELKSPLSFVIGKDIAGTAVVGDLAKMPHLLIAGQTGSGKSVMINTLLTSMLYRNSPSDLKMILVDPKQVELTPYNDIPHLLTPVITEPEKCISALKWAVAEMERRLRAMAEVGKRNIIEYNSLKQEEGMPYIVVVIDELADLMMVAARDVETLVVRLAQKARAAGIHLVLATQRPSVDVITGLIKANVPARIAFTVASQVDSRTIIDGMGAEKLLGMGDMLLYTTDMPKPKRVQGAFISDEESAKVTDFIRSQRAPQYDDEVVSQPVQLNGKGGIVTDYGGQDADDDMYKDAVQAVIEGRKASTSLLQRRLRIGYGRAARLIETMEEQGIIGHADGNRPRDVLVNSLDEVFGGGGAVEQEAMYDENFPEDTPPNRPLVQ